MQEEGLATDSDDTLPKDDGVERELAEPNKGWGRFWLQSTMRSYEVEEIDGGHLGQWIVSHRRKHCEGKPAPKAAAS
jgi:hypothetical protein